MPFRRAQAHQYTTLGDLNFEKDAVSWYWRLTALASSWMILGGYLVLPAAYDKEPRLRFANGVLNILIVTLLTAGYSFTALLCYACRNPVFQSESIFLPALASSALGLLTVLYNFAHSSRYTFNAAAIVSVALSAVSTIVYSILLVLAHRRVVMLRNTLSATPRAGKLYQDSAYYNNFIANMYPSSRNGDPVPPTDDDMVNQQMALLLMKSDSGPSPDASQSTFRIDLPDEPEHEVPGSQIARPAPSSAPRTPRETPPHESPALGGGGRRASAHDRALWDRQVTAGAAAVRARPDSGRAESRGTVEQRGRNLQPPRRERALSREERRIEIELGMASPPF